MPQVIHADAAFGPKGLFPNFFGGGLPLNFPLPQDLTLGPLKLDPDQGLYLLGLATAVLPATSVPLRRVSVPRHSTTAPPQLARLADSRV